MSFGLTSWNINEARPPGDLDDRFDWVEEAKRAQPDVLLVQECGFTADDIDLPRAAARLGLPYSASLVYSQAAHTPEGRAGLAILSRYRIAATRSRIFTNPVGSIRPKDVAREHRFNKGTLSALIDTPLGSLWVMNLHSYPFRFYDLTAEDKEASSVWDELAAETASLTGPMLLGGDFNTTNRDLLLDRAQELSRADPAAPPMIDDFVSRNVETDVPVLVDHSTSSDHPTISTTVINIPGKATPR